MEESGSYHRSDSSGLTFFNRAFSYGDGLFETIRVADGKALFVEDHFTRLHSGLQVLQLKNGIADDQASFKQLLSAYIAANNLSNARIRMQVFREDGGFYTPETTSYSYTLQFAPLSNSVYDPGKGLNVTAYELQKKVPGVLSGLKTTSALLYVMASLWAKDQGADDALIYNPSGNVIESARGNLFIWKDQQAFTPPLSEGCLNGVMRKQVIRLIQEYGHVVSEVPLTPTDLKGADEMWLTNVVQGICRVKRFGNEDYRGEMASAFTSALNQAISKN